MPFSIGVVLMKTGTTGTYPRLNCIAVNCKTSFGKLNSATRIPPNTHNTEKRKDSDYNFYSTQPFWSHGKERGGNWKEKSLLKKLFKNNLVWKLPLLLMK